MKVFIKMKKTTIKFDDLEIQKQNFHQHIRPISVKNVDINKVVVSNKLSFGKNDLNTLLAKKIIKKLDLYVYFSQKWVHMEKTLMKLSVYLF